MAEQFGPQGSTRKILQFITDDAHFIDNDILEVVVKFKDVFEKRIWVWDEFPLELPQLIRPDSAVVNLNDVFVRPNFDELRQVALEPNGRPIPLNEEKLREIRARGEFHVASTNFPGQSHRWRLSVLLQQGSERGTKNLHRTLALALEFLIIFVRNRFDGKRFSLKKSARAFAKAAEIFVDIVIGGRHLQMVDYSENLKNDKEKYLMADLFVENEEQQERLAKFVTYIKNGGKPQSCFFEPPPLPYEYSTPTTNIQINLILHDCRIREKVYQRLVVLADESNNRKQYIEMRQIVLEEIKNMNDDDDENLQIIANRTLKSLLIEKFFETIKNDEVFQNVSPAVSKILIENYLVNEIVDSERKIYLESVEKNCDKLRVALELQYPIRSKIKRWMKRQIESYKDNYHIANKWTVIDNVLELARREQLNQFFYFFDRNTYFEKEFQPTKEKEYQNIQQPSRTFKWRIKIWQPKNYIVKKHIGAKEETVKTRFDSSLLDYSKQFTDEPRNLLNADPKQVRYTVEKQTTHTTSTWYPFWRWTNFIHRNWVWTWNAMFYFAVCLPFGSRIGLRALVSPTVFYPEYEVNTKTGVLHPDPGSKTHSFVSRLRALWRHVHKSRAKFESTSDTGFLSKGITRHYNRFWNYIVKGFCGSVLLVLINPVVCIAASVLGLIVGFTSPLWMPIVVTLYYLVCVFIYDFDSPYKYISRRRDVIMLVFDLVVYRILILGIGQTVGALVTALILLPAGSVLLTIYAYIRFGIRSIWDTIMFQLVVKRYGRIPTENSFVARRISGPGLSSDYVYQITPEQALIAVEHRIQVLELEAFETQVRHWIDMPYQNFKTFMSSIQKYSGLDGFNCMARNVLQQQANGLMKKLENLTAQRRNELSNLISNDEMWRKIRVDIGNLEIILKQISATLEAHYPYRILNRLCDLPEETWWDMKNLSYRDWNGFAKIFCSDLFSPEFLIPLDDKQECFKLEVQHINLSKYLDMLVSGEHREDLDAVAPVFNSTLKKRLTLAQPPMPTSECMPFLLDEQTYGCGPLWLFKGGIDHEFGLPNLYKTAEIKVLELTSAVSQDDIVES